MAKGPAFYVYKDRAGEYRWTLVAGNNEKVADSAEGYETRSGAKQAARRVVGMTQDDDLHFHDDTE
jgi:uncharacterized protein YegP (UPF0339 family)